MSLFVRRNSVRKLIKYLYSKYCIQSETRFDFLKDLVTTVPELQGDLDCDGGLGVMGEMRVAGPGLGRARGTTRGTGRPTVPGTGKRRGRPPKVAGGPAGARTKRSVEKLVDSESECNDIIELHSEHWSPSVKKVCNGDQSGQSTQERLLLPHPETSPRPASYSSLFNIQRSASQEDFSPSRVGPAPTALSSAGSSSGPGLPFQLEISREKKDSDSRVPAPAPAPGPYQRTNSLPPPAPVYTGSYSRLLRSPSSSGWSLSPLPQPPECSVSASPQRNGAASLKTNGNLSLSTGPAALSQTSVSPRAPGGSGGTLGAELDEDYDC